MRTRSIHQKPAHKRHTSTSENALTIEERFAKLEKELQKVTKAVRNVEDRLQAEIRKLELAIKRKDRRIQDLEKSNTYLRNRLFGEQSEKKTLKRKNH